MGVMRKALILAIAAGALAVSGSRNGPITVGPRGELSPQALYSKYSKEHYLSVEDFTYIRPGYHITVNSLTIPADLKPLADVSFTDDLGQPLDRNGVLTPGTLSASMVLAFYDGTTRNYAAYTTRVQTSAPPSTTPGVKATQASADSGGTWTDLAVGHSTYKFKTALPANFDPTKTTTLAIYGTRSTTAIVGKDYYANTEYDFRPDGQAITESWDMIRNDACNTCHNPLSAHGGSRQDVKLCVTCHTPTTVASTPNIDPDTGNAIDFKVMIHKIHYGENLPSVQAGTPYVIIGFNQGINDFSSVALPQDIRNCTTCHAAPAAGAVNWYIYPSRSVCGSCHDDVNFDTGANHPAGAFADDSACASCHAPVGREWDASIQGAHTVPFKSTQLKGVKAQIVSVTNTAPGQKPTVVFNLTQNDGTPIPPSAFTTTNSDGTTSSGLNLIMSGPTTDYAVPPQIRERADAAAPSGSNYSYTFTNAIPSDSTGKGTWGFSIEARLTVTLNPAPRLGPTSVKDAAFNPVVYAPVTDSAAVPRRLVVDIDKCNACHDKLMLHGSNRLNPQECVFCHNPNANDGNTPPESIDFKRMIHKIHRGENLTHDYSIGDTSFNDVRFPGDLRDCQSCHTTDPSGTGTEQVSETPPPGLLATATPKDWYTPMQHYATACLACHDTQSAAAHAFVMTAPFGESCATCHGPDADFSVDKVHAR
jgi:OmcA/MtrC family decaheme c-type cytochrome